jgi:hypothetical protein
VAGWLSMDCWIYISSAMSFGLVSMFPYLSLILYKVVFSVFLKITLCILLGCRFKVFLYLEISFLQLIVVCFVMMSRAFFLVVFPMVSSIFIQSLISIGSFGGLGIFACGWFCRLVTNGWVLQLLFWVVNLMVFLMTWYVDISFFHNFFEFSGEVAALFICLVCECWDG